MVETLNKKEELFLSNHLLPTQILSKNDAQLSNGQIKMRASPILFEHNAIMSSDVISKSMASFIGANSYMNNLGYIRDDVFIGRFCSIGRRVTIAAGGHYMGGLSTSPLLSSGPEKRNYNTEEAKYMNFCEKTDQSRFTVIRSDVWIGDGAIVMPGVTIGVGAVIGANSVVTKDIAPYAIVGGAPAKHIRFRFPKEVCEKLLESQWWDLSVDYLKSLSVGNVLRFIDELSAVQSRRVVEDYETYLIET
jgi:virginiamycin A acetyltransferase